MKKLATILFAGLAVSAAPPPTPDAAVRAGVVALRAGDADEADRRFAVAAERTADPGRVAFNRATVAARRGDWRAAEAGFTQTLDDGECPPRRRAEATYNRGVCLLHRGGPAAAYRTAIDLFASAADQLGDDPLAADARHNRELAKLLWAQARQQERTPPNPGDLPPALPDLPPPQATAPGDETDGGTGGRGAAGGAVARGGTASGAGTAAGAGSLPVLSDADAVQPLTPAEARALLTRAAGRLAKDRQANARLLAGPERPHVRDW